MNVEIKKPNKIFIHELTLRNLDDFIHIHVRDTESPPLWCCGYVFIPYLFDTNAEYIIKEQIENGTIHYREFVIAPMPEYKPQLKRRDMGFALDVVNMDNDAFFTELIGSLIR